MAFLTLGSPGSVVALSFIAACCAIVASCYLNYRKCPQVKGPWLASVSGLWLLRNTWTGRAWYECAVELEKNGPLIRIAPDKLITNDPTIWRHMSAPRSNFVRGTWYDSMNLNPKVSNSLSERNDKAHTKLRSMLIRGYSGKEIPELENQIEDRIQDWFSNIRQHMAQGKAVDMSRLSQYFTLDVLTQIAFEEPFGYMTKNEDVYSYIKEVSGFLQILECGSNFPLIQSILSSRVMAPISPKPTDKTGMGAMLGVAKRVVEARYGPDAKNKDDMLGSFIKNGLSKEQAENESMLQILGGSDSTATAIRMTLVFILTNPRVYSKLMKELDDNAASFSTPIIKQSEAKKLPYLQACIKESMRVWPPLTGLQGKISPPGGETVNGVFIPGGVEVCWNSLSMQRGKDVYGSDPEVYRPERWIEAAALDDGGAKLSQMDRTVDCVFGAGRFSCLGKTVALMELDKVFVALLTTFDMTVVNPVNPIKTYSCWGAHVQTEMWVRAAERRK